MQLLGGNKRKIDIICVFSLSSPGVRGRSRVAAVECFRVEDVQVETCHSWRPVFFFYPLSRD